MVGGKRKITLVDFVPYDGLKNCFVNKNEKTKKWFGRQDPTISRYMPYVTFKKSVDDKSLFFVSPEKWTDPFEKIYLHTHFSGFPNIRDFDSPEVACLCFTRHLTRNSDAFWKSFKKDVNQQLVRVEFSLKSLLTQICSKVKNVHTYVSVIDYSLEQNIIEQPNLFLSNIINLNDNKRINPKELYVKMLSYKRAPFEYENEIRIFLVPGGSKEIQFLDNGAFRIKEFDYATAVKNVWIEPFPSGWITKAKAKEQMPLLSDRINRSGIYKTQKPCGQILFSDLKNVISEGKNNYG